MTLNYFLFFVKKFQGNQYISGKLLMAILAASAVLTGCGGGSSSTINEAAVLARFSPSLSIANVSVLEGSTLGVSNLQFTVTLSVAATTNVTVSYATSDGTALSASDYTSIIGGQLTILAGTTTGNITVLVGADTLPEASESLTVTLSNPVNARFAVTTPTISAIGTILNDDAYGLNDTGITLWTNGLVSAGGPNSFTVTQPTYPMQDADIGRDANITLNSAIDGKAGFSLLKLDAQGVPLVNQAVIYGTTPWSCVHDNVTGLTWEVKTTTPTSLQNMNNTYTWYNATGVNDGGNVGVPAAVPACNTGRSCDTEKYVAAVNGMRLCGFNDWRLPAKGNLRSIIDYSHVGSVASGPYAVPLIDAVYFPNTAVGVYWSSSPDAAVVSNTWNVNFSNGLDNLTPKSNGNFIRLVRGVL